MKKFGEGQQPFYAIVDIPEGDSQELTTVTDQALNSLYGELFNLLKLHGINPTATTNADLKQVARAVWSAVAAGNFYIDSGSENVKQLTHARASSYLFKNTNANDEAFTIEFLNKFANTGAVFINVIDTENNQNHFNNIPLVLYNGEELQAKQLPANTVVKARYNTSINKFVLDITLSYAKYIFDGNQTQEDINKSTVKKFDTVQKMLDDLGLVDGAMVETAGYYTVNDGGGARYTIRKTATDYSLPTKNGLNAVFCDAFNILRFGIKNDATLDQTENLRRLVNYADTRIYEIDFLGFGIMTPKITHFFTGRTTLVGMGFRKVHHLKNLTIANNKTEQLVQGVSPILFLPDDLNGRGKFKLSNVKIDPYVANYKINNGEADGYMCGFVVEWHKDSNRVYPNSNWVVSKYDIELDDIEFLSPAISYNLACGGIFTRNLIANNVRGDYWGLMLVHHTYNLDANNIHGVFRDDLHTPSGRLLVANLIHEEAEIADGVITRNNILVSNSSCYIKTSGNEHCVYKLHQIGTITINNFIGDNNIGSHEFYGGDNEASRKRLVIDNLTIKNGKKLRCHPTCKVNNALYTNFDILDEVLVYNSYYGNLVINDIRKIPFCIAYIGTDGTVDTLTVSNIKDYTNVDYGLIRNAGVVIGKINIINVQSANGRLVECAFNEINLDNVNVNVEFFGNFIFQRGNNAATINIKNSSLCAKLGTYSIFAASNGNFVDTLNIKNSKLVNTIMTINAQSQINYINSEVITSFNFDPPSLATATQQSLNFNFKGAKIGQLVTVSFDQALQGTRMWGEVTAIDTVTVYHRNDTGAAVDLPSGTLTVKIL